MRTTDLMNFARFANFNVEIVSFCCDTDGPMQAQMTYVQVNQNYFSISNIYNNYNNNDRIRLSLK